MRLHLLSLLSALVFFLSSGLASPRSFLAITAAEGEQVVNLRVVRFYG
jgi:hypothetical protein